MVPQSHRLVEAGRELWRLSSLNPCSKQHQPRTGCSGLCLVRVWISPRLERLLPLWTPWSWFDESYAHLTCWIMLHRYRWYRIKFIWTALRMTFAFCFCLLLKFYLNLKLFHDRTGFLNVLCFPTPLTSFCRLFLSNRYNIRSVKEEVDIKTVGSCLNLCYCLFHCNCNPFLSELHGLV